MIYNLKSEIIMKDYLEKALHMNVTLDEDESLYKGLPLFYKGMYILYRVNTNGAEWIAMQPKNSVGLSQIRKHRSLLEKTVQLNCVVFLEQTTYYSKEKMVEEGIPFVLENRDVYLPFLGVLLSGNDRQLKPVHDISFLTQKMLILGIIEGYEKATVTYIASRLGISKMAISKCFDEIEYLGIDVLDSKGRYRAITVNPDKKAAWRAIEPFCRNPVIRKFNLVENVKLSKMAGISALCEYSMLSDNAYPTYAITKEDINKSGIRTMKQAGRNDEIGCVVLELGYYIDSVKKNIQDPLSVCLSLDDEKNDERVELSIEEMLEEYVW